jgi:polysaccharide chain length determinant protein (PEP-CTERM system associated)
MIANRELGLDDYLAMLRRRLGVILIPAVVAPLIGFLVSYAFAPKYTSQATILVEQQKVPEGYVAPVVNEDVTQRMLTMEQQILARNRLEPMITRLGLAKKPGDVDAVVENIRQNIQIQPVQSNSGVTTVTKKGVAHTQQNTVPGFTVSYTDSNPRTAEQVCGELTSMLLEENLKQRQAVAKGTTDFLSNQLTDSKKALDDMDGKLAAFKKQYFGQLPGDAENNLRILQGLNSQLDANTQAINRAQQDKSYTESILAQRLEAFRSSQNATNPETLEQRLATLQSQLISLQARYTDDYPDVVKTKADIAETKRKLAELTAPKDKTKDTSAADDTSSSGEPPEVAQLRMQLHQYDTVIAQSTREQKRLQGQIELYQSRVSLSPSVEEQYKGMTRDYDTALKVYNDLLAKKSESEMQGDMERRQQGEQMQLLNAASLPDSPSFPNRWLFAAGGLGAGLCLGLGLALWLEVRDNSIRTEQDAMAALELPVLVSVPWVGGGEAGGYGNRNGKGSPGVTGDVKQRVEV